MALGLAAANPLQFAAALQILTGALQAPHPSLLAVLLDSSLAEPSSGKVCSLPCSASQALHKKIGCCIDVLVARLSHRRSKCARSAKKYSGCQNQDKSVLTDSLASQCKVTSVMGAGKQFALGQQ